MARVSPEFDNILDKYVKHRIATEQVIDLLGPLFADKLYGEADSLKRYDALVNCGTFLEFSKNVNRNDETIYRLTGSNFCRQRLCPMCQFRKSEKAFATAVRVVQKLEADGYRFLHLVLTVPNQKTEYELTQAISLMYKGFNRFFKYKTIGRAFKGALRCLEVSYNYENDTFHPHLHCLIAVRRSYFNDSRSYVSYDTARQLWTKAIKQTLKSFPGLSFITSETPDLQINLSAVKEGDFGGVAEVCKYCLKPLELQDEKEEQNKRILFALWYTLKGVRFVQKYGVLKEAFRQLDVDELTDETTPDEKTVDKLSLSWSFDSCNYGVVE